jgi:hypothetical protein
METTGNELKNVMLSAPPARRVLINVFLMFHLLVILVWSFPINLRSLGKIKRVIAPYMVWSGLAQRWTLFAPNPGNTNAYLVAQITYRDGQKKVWNFPMPQYFGYYRRYFMERQRKWSRDNLLMDYNAALWPDAARYVARLNSDLNNPPVTVELISHWSLIPPPTSAQPETWKQFTIFTYSVSPKDLL